MGRKSRITNQRRQEARERREAAGVGEICEAFTRYYSDVLKLSEEEFNLMIAKYKTQLPHVFRLSHNAPNLEQLEAQLEDLFNDLKLYHVEVSEITTIPKTFGRVFKLPFDKTKLRMSPNFEKFNAWLQLQTKIGNCHRQEFVSMIPPYFLDVRPDSVVLDTCAAPGSKTVQMLEMIKTGVVVANEIDLRRCHDLIHQLQRVGTARCLVTCQNAEFLELGTQKFDRVLCDVPCTGDGTIRKNPEAGAKWEPKGGLSLHFVQRKILLRGLEFLTEGGICVYSTCSMNPIEDEAVIGSVVKELGGAVEILDVSQKMPALKRHPGLDTWPVYNKAMEKVEKFEGQESLAESMFPVDLPPSIKNCMRFYPQDSDSGGFFVAVLKKVRDFERVTKLPTNTPKEFKELQFRPIDSVSSTTLQELRDIFGLGDNFKSDQAFVRDDKKVNSVYYFESPVAAQMVREIPHNTLRTVSGGVKVFTFKSFRKNQPEIPYPAQEGIHVISKYITKRKFCLTPQEMLLLLSAGTDGLQYSKLRPELGEELRTGPRTGALFCIENSQFEYTGITFKATLAVFLRNDLLQLEKEKLVAKYPELAPKP